MKNPFKEIKRITIPIKIKHITEYGIGASNYYELILPTLGIQKTFNTNKEAELRALLEFLGSESCDSTCQDCKYWRYYLKCHKLEDWEEEQKNNAD